MSAHTRLSKVESIAKTHEQYETAKALLAEWEPYELKDPEYVTYLRRKVAKFHSQLVNKGAILPHET